MLTILFSLHLAFAIKDGLDEDERSLLCGRQLVQGVMTTHGFNRTVTVYRDGNACAYRRTDRGYHRAEPNLYPLRLFLGDDMVNARRLGGRRVLDAGCGDGGFVRHLIGLGAHARGLDVKLIEDQRAEPDLFVEADMLTTGLAPASLDYIFTSFSTFYYEPMNFRLLHGILAEFARVLAPGGRIVIGGNPRRRLAAGDPLDEYLRDGYSGRNDYLARLVDPRGGLRLEEVGRDRVVLIKAVR